MPPRSKRVSASQVGQYAYCARAWWLAVVEKREPVSPALLDAGTRMHERHGWEVSLARGTSRLALALSALAALALTAWALVAFIR
jgi:CRISPR/Cas system-associated exonuclease Cas4 (RecB family)